MELPPTAYTEEDLKYLDENISRLRQKMFGQSNTQDEPDADAANTLKQGKSCFNCQHYGRKCPAGWDNPCDDFRAKPEIDRQILIDATDKVDKYHRGFTNAPQPEAPKIERDSIYVGQVLYYKNKFSGKIEGGVVDAVNVDFIEFRYKGSRSTVLPRDVIGNRLFFSEREAEAYGKTEYVQVRK